MNFYDFNGMNGCGCDKGDDFKNKFDTYTSKSESELMEELTKVAQRMKADGSFDVGMLENLYNTASPMLNDVQRARMRSIIDALKG